MLQPGDRKISGTAARISHGRAYHHLTLLVRPNLSALRQVLKSPLADLIETNATRSVRAKAVGQLIDVVPGLETGQVVNVLVDGFQSLAENAKITNMDSSEIQDDKQWNGVERSREELKSAEWIFGKSPKFSIQLLDSDGQLKRVVVEHGHVIESQNDLYEIGFFFDRIK